MIDLRAFAILVGDELIEITGDFQSGAGDDLVNHPTGWLDAASADEIAAIGALPIVDDSAPGPDHRVIGRRLVERDGVAVRTYETELVSAEEARRLGEARVLAERARRLALGFDFDFGDARGIHRIGTTEDDMRGWDEVSKGAQAAMFLDQPDEPIGIVTDTGPVAVTAREWQMVLARASIVRQPIYAASFALQAMNPIPDDVVADDLWP